MRHAKRGKRLGSNASQKKTILQNLTRELIRHKKIKTTELRAKEVRSMVDKAITLGKRGDLHARRQALNILGSKELVHDLFTEISPSMEDRSGGYTRILKIGPRKGDNAEMVYLELVS